MSFLLQPWQILLAIVIEWVRREQEKAIEYLGMENQVLKEQLGIGRILLDDDQRRRLAVKGQALSRKSCRR